MNFKRIGILMACLLALLLGGCSREETPYQINDAQGYTVSVKYDANGGIFTTNTSVMVDAYDISRYTGGSEASIALLSPDNAARGNDAFSAVNNGYFLAGWYSQRTQTGTDEAGNPTYSYSGRWDFDSDLLTVDASGTYTSAEPVLTLYAAWVPLFEIEFYALDSGELLGSYTYNPTTEDAPLVPVLDEKTGAMELYRFPERSGYTFAGAYYDEAGKEPVTTAAVEHPGAVDYTTGTASDPTMALYTQWTEGEWFHIYNAEQFLENASVSGSYVLHADLDLEGEIWPTSLMYGNFSGTIQGNGHTIKNVQIVQTNNSKVNAGLFGYLTETASITDLTLENVTFTVKSGTRVVGTSYGLLAGTVSADAQLSGLHILSSRLLIDSGCYFGVDDYAIGLVCGMGDAATEICQITCEATGDDPDSLEITVAEDGQVTVTFKNQ